MKKSSTLKLFKTTILPSAWGSSNLNFLRGRVGELLGELLGEGRGDGRGDRGLLLVGEDSSKVFVLLLLSDLSLLLSLLLEAAGSSFSGSAIPRAARLAARRSLHKT